MKRNLLILLVLIGALISYLGYLKNKNIVDNQEETIGTITDVFNMTGDRNVPKVKKPIESYKVSYKYEVNGTAYSTWDIITIDDIQYGFPLNFKEGTIISIIYNRQDPSNNKLKCKLKLPEDKVDGTKNQ